MMMNDWRYTDERMAIRQKALLALKKYNTLDHVRQLYEFCDVWVSQGKSDTKGIEAFFLEYCENDIYSSRIDSQSA